MCIPPLIMAFVFLACLFALFRLDWSAEPPAVLSLRRRAHDYSIIKLGLFQLFSVDKEAQKVMFNVACEEFQLSDIDILERIVSLLTEVPGLPRNRMSRFQMQSCANKISTHLSDLSRTGTASVQSSDGCPLVLTSDSTGTLSEAQLQLSDGAFAASAEAEAFATSATSDFDKVFSM